MQNVSAKKFCFAAQHFDHWVRFKKKPHYFILFAAKKLLPVIKNRKEVKLSSFVLTSINLSPNKLQSQLPARIQVDQSVADEQKEVPARVRNEFSNENRNLLAGLLMISAEGWIQQFFPVSLGQQTHISCARSRQEVS